jgi:hypothetical protein
MAVAMQAIMASGVFASLIFAARNMSIHDKQCCLPCLSTGTLKVGVNGFLRCNAAKPYPTYLLVAFFWRTSPDMVVLMKVII